MGLHLQGVAEREQLYYYKAGDDDQHLLLLLVHLVLRVKARKGRWWRMIDRGLRCARQGKIIVY